MTFGGNPSLEAQGDKSSLDLNKFERLLMKSKLFLTAVTVCVQTYFGIEGRALSPSAEEQNNTTKRTSIKGNGQTSV